MAVMIHMVHERVNEHETQPNLVAVDIKPQGFQVHVFTKACWSSKVKNICYTARVG